MKRGLSGAAILAIISTIASVLAIASIVILLGWLSPDELAQLGRLAE